MSSVCEVCGYPKTTIKDSRDYEHTKVRRRECAKCGYRWTTMEVTIDNAKGSEVAAAVLTARRGLLYEQENRRLRAANEKAERALNEALSCLKP